METLAVVMGAARGCCPVDDFDGPCAAGVIVVVVVVVDGARASTTAGELVLETALVLDAAAELPDAAVVNADGIAGAATDEDDGAITSLMVVDPTAPVSDGLLFVFNFEDEDFLRISADGTLAGIEGGGGMAPLAAVDAAAPFSGSAFEVVTCGGVVCGFGFRGRLILLV
jgi:hypothetical protein